MLRVVRKPSAGCTMAPDERWPALLLRAAWKAACPDRAADALLASGPGLALLLASAALAACEFGVTALTGTRELRALEVPIALRVAGVGNVRVRAFDLISEVWSALESRSP